MTVCIAAVANGGKNIIFAADQMLGVGGVKADFASIAKGYKIHNHWMALYSGDASLVSPILLRVRAALDEIENANFGEVSDTLFRIYREERVKFAEQAVLSPFSLDMPTFVDMMATNDTAEISDLKRRIEDVDFGCEFLVGGFDCDDGNRAHIFTISPPAVIRSYNPLKFWSIGSGADLALSSLLFRRFREGLSLETAIYHVAEAKFMSEAATGVGKNSVFIHLDSGGNFSMLPPDRVPALRQLWEAEGQPPIPPNLSERVPKFLSVPELAQREKERREKKLAEKK